MTPASASSPVPPPISNAPFVTATGGLTPSSLGFLQALWSAVFGSGQSIINKLPQPGFIQPFGGGTVPDGWLLCDGAAYLETDYPDLFAAIGTTWGSPGEGQFNVPDGKNKFLLGASTDNPLGTTGGAFTQTIAQSNLPEATLDFTATNSYAPGTIDINQGDIATTGGSATGVEAIGAGTYTNGTGTQPTVTLPDYTPTGTVALGGSGDALDTTPPFIAVNYLIKT